MKIKSPGPNVAKTIKVKEESIRFYDESSKNAICRRNIFIEIVETLEEMGQSVKRWRLLNSKCRLFRELRQMRSGGNRP